MNTRLTQLYQEDMADRNANISTKDLDKKDSQRKQEVQHILDTTKTFVAEDYHHAALIFQHGETVEDYQKAHQLAQKAVDMGDITAEWLAKATLDRSLLAAGKPQKYGTQFRINEKGERIDNE